MVKRFKSSHEDAFPSEMVTCRPKSLKMVAGSYYIPKKNELKPLQEDAHFIGADKQTIGVADGVAGGPGKAWMPANVGDNGFVIIRGGKIIYKSPVQQRGFNCPYQLGNGAKQVAVEAGDVIVAGNDGLFDNVYCKEIEEMVKMGMEDMGELAEDLAWSMARFALVRSLDTCFCSPFATASTRAGLEHMENMTT